jgi:hypothetical protein
VDKARLFAPSSTKFLSETFRTAGAVLTAFPRWRVGTSETIGVLFQLKNSITSRY